MAQRPQLGTLYDNPVLLHDGRPLVYGGKRGHPKHLFINCPHVLKLDESGSLRAYPTASGARISSFLGCHWCRARWLTSLVNGGGRSG